MSYRKAMNELNPTGYQPLLDFDKYIAESELGKLHWEMIKIRVSQINGCAFCLDKHIADAVKLGEKQQRINVLSVWRETDFFDEKEKAILALAEQMTLIANNGVSDEVYDNAISILGEKYTSLVMLGIISMNSWNRLGVTTHRKPKLKA